MYICLQLHNTWQVRAGVPTTRFNHSNAILVDKTRMHFVSKGDIFSYDVPMKGAREFGGMRKKRDEMREKLVRRREFGVIGRI